MIFVKLEKVHFWSKASVAYITVYANAIGILLLFSCCAGNFEELEPKKSKIDQRMTILESICVATF